MQGESELRRFLFNPFNRFNRFNPFNPFNRRTTMKRLLLLLSIVLLSAGCGRAKRAAGDAASAAADATKAVAGKAGHAVGEHVGTFFAAVGEGVEQSVCDYETRVDDPALEAAGVSVTLVRRVTGDDRAPALSLYLLNGRSVAGTLRARLLAADGREIGRGEAALDRAADGAGYVRVPVPADTPSELVRTVSLSLVPSESHAENAESAEP